MFSAPSLERFSRIQENVSVLPAECFAQLSARGEKKIIPYHNSYLKTFFEGMGWEP